LPPVEVGAIDSSSNNSNGKLVRSRPRSLLARVENRILQVKEHNQVESVLKTAEQALHLRRKEALGRWANSSRNFVSENRCQTVGRPCCRRRKELERSQHAKSAREGRRAKVMRSRE
ncbi:unnamed protein product, partial [Ectocarpus sp. 12 AP-2014]